MPAKPARDVRPGDRVRVGNSVEAVTRARVRQLDGQAVVHFVHEEPGRKIEWSEFVDTLVETE